jgi:hypothetical protein
MRAVDGYNGHPVTALALELVPPGETLCRFCIACWTYGGSSLVSRVS